MIQARKKEEYKYRRYEMKMLPVFDGKTDDELIQEMWEEVRCISKEKRSQKYIKAKIPKIAIIVFILVFSICLSLSISINIRHRTAINKDMIFKIRLTVIIFSFSS